MGAQLPTKLGFRASAMAMLNNEQDILGSRNVTRSEILDAEAPRFPLPTRRTTGTVRLRHTKSAGKHRASSKISAE
jgi:hypothetical protein